MMMMMMADITSNAILSSLPASPLFISVYTQLIIITLASVRYPKLAFIYVLLLLPIPWIAPIDTLSNTERIFIFFHLFCCEIWRFVDYAFDGVKTADSPAATHHSTKTADGIDMENYPMDRVVHMLTYQGVTKRTKRVHAFTFDIQSLITCIGHCLITYTIYTYIAPTIYINISPYIGIHVGKFIAATSIAFGNVNLFTAISDGMDFTFKLLGYALEPYCQDFWSAEDVSTFWRLWNTPFQRVLYRHVYHPLHHILGFSRNMASLATFIVSSAAHWIPLTSFIPNVNRYESFLSWNLFFISQYLVCGIESYFHNTTKPTKKATTVNPAMANTLKWFYASMPSGLHHGLTLFWITISATAVHIPIFNYLYNN